MRFRRLSVRTPGPIMITLFGIPIPLAFILAPALVIVLVAMAASYVMMRFSDLSGLGLKLASVLLTELIVALILSAMLFASSRNLLHPEDKVGFSFAVFYAAIAFAISFVVAIPSVYFAIEHLFRR